MLAAALIVFREVLEAALVVSIIMSASRGVANRGRWIMGGLLGGLLGAVCVATFAGSIANAVEGRGQELLNAAILLSAVIMLAWHNVWMSAHGKTLSKQMKRLGHDVGVGLKPLSAIALVAGLAVMREGSETALFLYSLSVSGSSTGLLAGGALLGLGGGMLLGLTLYRGLLAIPIRHFFRITGWMILLLAAGLAANAAGLLNQAGLLPALGQQIWDSSGWLNQGSWAGTLLHILVGYNDRPMGIQILTYGLALMSILLLMQWAGRRVISQSEQTPD
ncbi:iron permease [Acidihalobacter yilgarnensis]|uniref:Iron permease n=1 Tax=Acidihalobacter yilgarnensis TaxID=2819280 RepID=A0A1D8IMH9_9GAMM|nr:FTR1 family protein [Acidihalobacter yilgarnensis]AOU97668.1 iron permease [Acidihalobacter yilgarnensis]